MISFIIITNSKKFEITLRCLDSIFENMKHCQEKYEIIMVGDICKFENIKNIKFINCPELAKQGKLSSMRNRGAEIAQYDILFFMDDDVLLSDVWYNNFLKFNNNNDWTVYSCRLLLPNGDRCWDRAVVFRDIHTLVSYEHDKHDENLYQTGTFLVIYKNIFNQIKFDETLNYYSEELLNEDVVFSKKLYELGYCIDFDKENYITHCDESLIQMNNIVVKKNQIKNLNNVLNLNRTYNQSKYENTYNMCYKIQRKKPNNQNKFFIRKLYEE